MWVDELQIVTQWADLEPCAMAAAYMEGIAKKLGMQVSSV
jgi:hypothetical protein